MSVLERGPDKSVQIKNSHLKNDEIFKVETMSLNDLPIVTEMLNQAFDKMFVKLLGGLPPGKKEGIRVEKRFFRKNSFNFIIKDENGLIQGACFMQKMGSKITIGPIAVNPKLKNPLSAFEKIRSHALTFFKENVFAETVTFPHSPLHFALHWKAFDPQGPCPYFSKYIGVNFKPQLIPEFSTIEFDKYSILKKEQLAQADSEMKKITQKIFKDLDLCDEAQHVVHQRIGECFLMEDEEKNIIGFAICHFGEKSESFLSEELLIKHLYFDPEVKNPIPYFKAFLIHLESFALSMGLKQIGMMANSDHSLAVNCLLKFGYMITQIHTHWSREYNLDLKSKNYQNNKVSLNRDLSNDSHLFVLNELR